MKLSPVNTILYYILLKIRYGLIKGGGQSKISLPDKKSTSGREIIIYLNPFPQTNDEEYKLFLDNSKTPFSVVTNVGEIHIAGVAYDFSGNMIIKRDGYKSSSLSIEPGKEKLYLHADLSQSNNPQIKNKIPKPPPWKRPKPKDCAGVVGGSAVVDECGVCDGDGASCIEDEKRVPEKRVPEKRKESFRKPPSNKIEKKFGGFWGFPGGTINGIGNFSKDKYNLSATYGTDFGEMTGYEIGIGIRSPNFKILKYDNLLVKFVMGNRSWDDVDYSYKGIMINKEIRKFFGEVGLVIGNDDVYDSPQIVMKLGLMK